MVRPAIFLLAAISAQAAPPPLPRHFLLGVATSGYQSEGGETNTNWDAWQRAHPDTVAPVGRAVDFYHRYPADVARAARMGLNAFRFGIEWARIEPAPGRIERAALAHYRRLLQTLRRRRLEPIVTLNHFTWPEWLEDEAHAAGAPSAWEYAPSADAFVAYVRMVVKELSGRPQAFKVGASCADLYAGQPAPAAAISPGSKQDYLSFDYYYSFDTIPDLTQPIWTFPIYPPALLDALRRYHAAYPELPILIPENGIGTENGMPRADGWTREAVLVQHVAAVQAAVAEGIPVIGYCHWSLTDNYEWGSYTPRFGLFRVDALSDTRLVRHPTPAVKVYREIARHRGVTDGLLAAYPGP